MRRPILSATWRGISKKLFCIVTVSLTLCSASAARAGERFRVMALNGWHGGASAHPTGQEGRRVGVFTALPKMAALLSFFSQGHPTLVGLQEMSSGAGTNCGAESYDFYGVNGPQLIRDSMGGPGWNYDYLQLKPYCGGTYGLANLYNVTKYKEQEWLFMFDPNNTADWGSEQRGANLTKHDFGNGHVLWFINTHLGGASDNDNGVIPLQQVFELLGQLKRLDPDQPQIVVGDFNIKAKFTGPYAGLLRLLADPTLSGFVKVYEDVRMYMFLYDPHGRLTLRGASSIPAAWAGTTLSDHNLLIAEFEWK